MEILSYLLLLIIAAFIGGVILKSLNQPPIIGYLLAGLMINLIWGGQISSDSINFLSELGIVLLLFTLGLEFSFHKLKKVAYIAVIGGLLQILLSWFFITLINLFFKFDLFTSIFMAATFSLSSTAVVVKLLVDRGEIDTLAGEIMVAWLIIQDLAVLPMIVILPIAGKLVSTEISGALVWSVVNGLGLVAIILTISLVLGRYVVPWLVNQIALLNSRELLLVGVFGLAVAGAWLTQVLGLSAALGAFLAGLLIAESAQQHAVFAEIRPLRNLFLLIFFTSLGMALPGNFMFTHFLIILMLTLAVLLIKFLIVLGISLFLGSHIKTSFIVGVALIEVSEFAFLLARIGLSENVISQEIFSLILSVTLLSVLFMPPMYLAAPLFYDKFKELMKRNFRPLYLRFFTGWQHHEVMEELPFKDHVVLCGYGRVGKYIGRSLEMAQIPYIVIEFHQHIFHQLKQKGIPVIYGDAADKDILDYAQVDKAKAIVVAVPDLHSQLMIVTHSLTLNKDIQIFCRTHHEENQTHLKAMGVSAIIQPEFEASLSITQKILKLFNQTPEDIDGKLSRLKIEHGLG